MIKSIFFFCLNIILFSSLLKGQDVQFSQFYNSPIYLNPALSGSDHLAPRLSIATRHQALALPSAFKTYSVSFDLYSTKLKGGISLNLLNDIIGNNVIIDNTINLAYSYHQKLSDNYFLLIGVEVGWNQNFLNWNKITFGDIIDPRIGSIYQLSHIPISKLYNNGYSTTGSLGLGTGIALYAKYLEAGLSIKHLNRPSNSFVGGSEHRLSMRFAGHIKSNIILFNDFTFSPGLLYTSQNELTRLNFGANFCYKIISMGSYYASNNQIMFSIGLNTKKMRLHYSYDFTKQEHMSYSAGELGLVIKFY